MVILAIDTSTPHGSVAVLRGSTIATVEEFTADRSHSSSLFSVLERLREMASRYDRIVIGLGPGSYAGIRIAIAAAMGISLTQGSELLGIPSVAALQTDLSDYVAIGDARRDTFYWTTVRAGVCVEGPLLLTEADLKARIAAETLPLLATEPVAVAPHAVVALPSAARLARLAAAETGIIQRGDLEPIYLREPYITQSKKPASLVPRSA